MGKRHGAVKSKYRGGMYIADLMCLGCGRRYSLPRPLTKHRPYGHIKDCFCPHCGSAQYVEFGYYGKNEFQDAELVVTSDV